MFIFTWSAEPKLRLQSQRGQGLVEYALVLVLVAVVVIGILTVLGPTIGGVFSDVVASLDGGGGSDALYANMCSSRSYPSGQSESWPFDTVVYKSNDGYVYIAKVGGVWASYPTDVAEVAAYGVTDIYGYIPANTTVTCP